jgi:hypothetical protein
MRPDSHGNGSAQRVLLSFEINFHNRITLINVSSSTIKSRKTLTRKCSNSPLADQIIYMVSLY